MGVGNYFVTNGRTVQVDHNQIYGEYIDGEHEFIEDEWDYTHLFNNFLEIVGDQLPTGYEQVNKYDHHEGARIIAENGFYTVQVKEWEGYVAISLVIKDDDEYEEGVHPLAKHHLDTRATTLFDKLATCYELRIRTSAWTSGKYEISNVA